MLQVFQVFQVFQAGTGGDKAGGRPLPPPTQSLSPWGGGDEDSWGGDGAWERVWSFIQWKGYLLSHVIQEQVESERPCRHFGFETQTPARSQTPKLLDILYI